MKKRFLSAAAVMLILTRECDGRTEVLLQRRAGTGWRDGYYDLCAAGHVEEGESLTRAMAREACEELGINIAEGDISLVCLIHKRSGGESYLNAYFTATRFDGEPRINEPEKCSELGWYHIDSLPSPMVEDRPLAIECMLRGVHYAEYGWEDA